MDNVNNLNGVPNFGHGYPESNETGPSEGQESDARVQEGDAPLGVEEGAESEVEETSDSGGLE